MNLESISENLEAIFCDRRIRFCGIVEKTRSRIGIEIVDVLRKVEHERGFQPIVYEGGILAFIVLDSEMVFNSNRNSSFEATLVVFSDQYGDHKDIIANLDRYDFQEVRLLLDSQGIYGKWFNEDDNKPFQGFAFEIKLNFSDNFSLCCPSFDKKC
jgi:hypothetical protein